METQKQLLPIVGVGASAGGLEAFTAFLKELPPDSGMAFVLLQHQDPKQHSQLTSLLSRATKIPVVEVVADTAVRPNHVYVLSPGIQLSMEQGTLRVSKRETGPNLPIDYFLRSLAKDQGSQAVGIVLSGTASDGTLGLKAVKAEGGITFAQDPSSAKFDGMPRSAIAAGVADFVLAPGKIAQRLVQLGKHPAVGNLPEHLSDAQDSEFHLNTIFQLVRAATGNDFSRYKRPMVKRRIQRRMILHGLETLADYVAYLRKSPAEGRALGDDLLICVTSFFREPEAFAALTAHVFPELVKKRPADDPIRIWVPGCATGEEVYSIAISLHEFFERTGTTTPVRMFATDLSEAALEKARGGIYEAAAMVEISPARLKRFFVKVDAGYQIQKSIRENCIFAKQNIFRDPPFRNIDLISCQNVLIYFGQVLQRSVLAMFHYALKPGGYLLVGNSESVSVLPNAFRQVDKKVKLYARAPGTIAPTGLFASADPLTAAPPASAPIEGIRVGLDVQRTAERLLLNHYAPAGVIVDDAMNIVHIRGNVTPYLQLQPGEPTYSLLRMAREGLVAGLRAAMFKAKAKKAVVKQEVRVRENGNFKKVNLRVVPIDGSFHGAAAHFLILFEEVAPEGARKARARAAKPGKAAKSSRVPERLRQELAATREYLQSIIEEQEASTEELKSANEEAQATNEELETAREELQSTNEELNTLNDELRARNIALTEANSDLANVLASTNVPLIMVGKDLKIRRYTPSMEAMLNLIPSDVGRSISDLKPNIDVPDLASSLNEAVRGRRPPVRQVQGPDRRSYSVNLLPYKEPDGKINGALLVLMDIEGAKVAREYGEAIVNTVPLPLVVLDKDRKVSSANPAFYETFKVSERDTEDCSIFDVGNGQWNIPELRDALERTVTATGRVRNLKVHPSFDQIGRKTLLINVRELQQRSRVEEVRFLMAIEDITEREQWEERLKKTYDDFEHFVYAASHDLQEPLRMVNSYTELIARDYKEKLGPQADKYIRFAMEGAQRIEELLKGMREYWRATQQGEEQFVSVDCNTALEEALSNLAERIAESGASITHDPLPAVPGQEVLLMELFQNLVGNAIKYRGKSPPTVHVSATKDSANQWVFSVKDNGIGIDPRYAQKIFQVFSRLERDKPGSGMGLAICRLVVERLGGRIWVESMPGRGADFRFTLPAGE